MELLEGQTLRRLIAGKPLEIETVLDLGMVRLPTPCAASRWPSDTDDLPGERIGVCGHFGGWARKTRHHSWGFSGGFCVALSSFSTGNFEVDGGSSSG